MLIEIIQKSLSRLTIPAVLIFFISLLGWLINWDDWARNLLWGIVAKMPSIVLVSAIVFYAKYPVFIPVTGILIVFLFILLVDAGRAFLTDWSSKIELSPDIRRITDKKNKNVFIFGPTVRNTGATDITDCFVYLERVYWFPMGDDGNWSAGGEIIFSGRLSWLESTLQSMECKRTIERDSIGISVRLVEQEQNKPMKIRLCDDKFTLTKGKYGQLRLLIRVGGVANNWSIKPIFAMVTVSRELESGDGVSIDYADLRVIKKREEFDKMNRVLDSIHLELNEKNKVL